jgi:hypothetical protein
MASIPWWAGIQPWVWDMWSVTETAIHEVCDKEQLSHIF